MSIDKALAMQLLDLQHRLQEAEGIVAGLFDGPVFQSTNIQPRMCSGVTEPPVMWNATAHALGCQMNNGRPVLACVCGLPNKDLAFPDPDLTRCPQCGGPADNGHDRCLPPNPYACSKCQPPADPPIPAMPERQHDPVAGLERESSYIRRMEAHARDLARRLEEALDELRLVTSPHESVGAIMRDLKAERDAARAEAARLQEENTRERDEQGRLRDDLRAMTEAKDHAVSEATRHFESVLTLQAQVQTLAEAAKGMLGPEWECGHGTPITEPCGFCKEEDNPCHRWRAALASLEVKP